MKRFTVLAAIAAAAIGLGAAGAATGQESPTPQPTSTATLNLCTGIPVRSGVSINFGFDISVTLPGGANFTVQGVAPPPDIGSIVCYVEGNARVIISRSCSEIRRENPDNDPSADFVLDLVVDSCEVIATPTPTPSAAAQGSDDDYLVTVTPTPSGGTITPPSTGDAGLR